MTYLFGYRGVKLEHIADSITAQLNVQAELRESGFRGGDYWLFRYRDEQAILQTNTDGGPGEELAEEAFREWPVLLYVETDHKDGMAAKLNECTIRPTLLRVSRL